MGRFRSYSMSNGASPFIERPAVDKSATRLSAIGFATGAHGISSWLGSAGMPAPRVFLMKFPANRQGSTSRAGGGPGGVASGSSLMTPG